MWFVAPVEGINSVFGRFLVRGQQLRKVQLAWFVVHSKKKGLASNPNEMCLTDDIEYVNLQRVGSICN